MNEMLCKTCGSSNFTKKDNFWVCDICGNTYADTVTDDRTINIQINGLFHEPPKSTNNKLKRCQILVNDGEFDEARRLCIDYLNDVPEDGYAYEILLLCDLKMTSSLLYENPQDFSENKNFQKIKKYGPEPLHSYYQEIINIHSEKNYIKAKALINSPNKKTSDLSTASTILLPLALKKYKDSEEIFNSVYCEINKIAESVKNLPKNSYMFQYGRFQGFINYPEGYVIVSPSSGESVTLNYWDIVKITTDRDACSGTIKFYGIDYKKRENSTVLLMCEAEDIGKVRSGLEDLANRIKLVGNDTCEINTSFDFENEQAKIDAAKIQLAKSGCYVATCVYGSYDCPEVWTLRRYRDDTLGSTWYGRLFIRTYYAISPTLVKWFGKTNWFKKLWKGKLDRMVAKLQAKGVEDTPYEDKNW